MFDSEVTDLLPYEFGGFVTIRRAGLPFLLDWLRIADQRTILLAFKAY